LPTHEANQRSPTPTSRFAEVSDGGATSAEREELSKLRRENHRLRQERDILAKAAAWFAKDKTPSGSSNS
jgi:transposase